MTTSSKPLRLGILGAANIARQFARDVSGSKLVKLAAIASRDGAKAKEFAGAFGIAKTFASYEAMLASADIDAIYLPLPNSMHATWAIKAAEHGKHVLCEKPLGMNGSETAAMFAAARRHKVFLLESYPYWFQPQTAAMMSFIDGSGGYEIGPLRFIQAAFGFTLMKPDGNIRMNPDLGGGALMDAGCYPLSLISLAMRAAPVRVEAQANYAASGVDISTMATLHYADGRRAQLACAMDGANFRQALIVGTKGTLETEYLNHCSEDVAHPHGYLPSLMRLRRGIANTVPFEVINTPGGSGFRYAAEAFAGMIANGNQAMMDDYAAVSQNIAVTLAAIAQSARDGKSVNL
ncbi:MAG: Gfo/Idh/MocA family oxidoreductase [Hyphomicrobiales bacterium]|nr:Gfo/Idh/MocA family oxidoreductase [Hyphomicrobiales bacterium]